MEIGGLPPAALIIGGSWVIVESKFQLPGVLIGLVMISVGSWLHWKWLQSWLQKS